jgi:hypothetical protein
MGKLQEQKDRNWAILKARKQVLVAMKTLNDYWWIATKVKGGETELEQDTFFRVFHFLNEEIEKFGKEWNKEDSKINPFALTDELTKETTDLINEGFNGT